MGTSKERAIINLEPGKFELTVVQGNNNYYHRPGWVRRETVKMEVAEIVETDKRYSFNGNVKIFCETGELLREEAFANLRKSKPFDLPEWILILLEKAKNKCIK